MSYFRVEGADIDVDAIRANADSLESRNTLIFSQNGSYFLRVDGALIGEIFGYLSDVSVVDFEDSGIIQNVAQLGGIYVYQVSMDDGKYSLSQLGYGDIIIDEVLQGQYPTFVNNSFFERLIMPAGRSDLGYLPEFYIEVTGGVGVFDETFGQFGLDAPNDGRVLVTRGAISGERDIAWGNWLDVISYGSGGGPGGGGGPGNGPFEPPVYDQNLYPQFDNSLGRVVSPLYDTAPDGSFSVPGIGDFDFGGTKDEFLKQLADTGFEIAFEKATERLAKIGVPDAFITEFKSLKSTIQDAKQIYDIVTNFHSRLFEVLTTAIKSENPDARAMDSEIGGAVGDFYRDAGGFLGEKFLGYLRPDLHVESVNSFRINHWGPSDTIVGGEKEDVVLSSEFADTILPNYGMDVVLSMGGNDTIQAEVDGFYDQFELGSGLDRIIYNEQRANMSVQNHSGAIFIIGGDLSIDVAHELERLVFSDGVLAFDTAGNAGQAYRIYQAAFDRTPDNGGLAFWIGQIDGGISLYQVGLGFIGSPEFQNVYGTNVSSGDFIDRLYQNILDREGEAGGRDFWVNQLETGQRDKASVLIGFSESVENVALVAPTIDGGIWIQ